jgi:beta-catenin-like protein 1
MTQSDIERIVEDGQDNEVEMLTPLSLKQVISVALRDTLSFQSTSQMLLNFEKKITKNQTMRMKHANHPEKFLDSELDLHREINSLYVISASPELYSILVEAGSVSSILGMLAHDNTDMSIATLGLLSEMTDADTLMDVEDALVFVDALVEGQV